LACVPPLRGLNLFRLDIGSILRFHLFLVGAGAPERELSFPVARSSYQFHSRSGSPVRSFRQCCFARTSLDPAQNNKVTSCSWSQRLLDTRILENPRFSLMGSTRKVNKNQKDCPLIKLTFGKVGSFKKLSLRQSKQERKSNLFSTNGPGSRAIILRELQPFIPGLNSHLYGVICRKSVFIRVPDFRCRNDK
jgi:hypothetical protein